MPFINVTTNVVPGVEDNLGMHARYITCYTATGTITLRKNKTGEAYLMRAGDKIKMGEYTQGFQVASTVSNDQVTFQYSATDEYLAISPIYENISISGANVIVEVSGLTVTLPSSMNVSGSVAISGQPVNVNIVATSGYEYKFDSYLCTTISANAPAMWDTASSNVWTPYPFVTIDGIAEQTANYFFLNDWPGSLSANTPQTKNFQNLGVTAYGMDWKYAQIHIKPFTTAWTGYVSISVGCEYTNYVPKILHWVNGVLTPVANPGQLSATFQTEIYFFACNSGLSMTATYVPNSGGDPIPTAGFLTFTGDCPFDLNLTQPAPISNAFNVSTTSSIMAVSGVPNIYNDLTTVIVADTGSLTVAASGYITDTVTTIPFMVAPGTSFNIGPLKQITPGKTWTLGSSTLSISCAGQYISHS